MASGCLELGDGNYEIRRKSFKLRTSGVRLRQCEDEKEMELLRIMLHQISNITKEMETIKEKQREGN